MPDLDDLLGNPGAARPARARRGVGVAVHVALLRRRAARPRPGQGRGPVRDGDDREAGGLGRAREHHGRAGAERRRPGRRVRDHGPQVVLLGADVRRVPGTRPGGRWPLVLPAAPIHARRRAQPLPHPAAQGQARQPIQRFERGRVPGRVGAADRRGGPRRPGDHRDGQPHAARLHDRLDGGDAGRGRDGDTPLLAAVGVREAADRPAADAERARRPRGRVRGGDGVGDEARANVRRGRA